jgi:hypothetical protein
MVEITSLNIDSFDAYSKRAAPKIAAIKPTKCE